MSDKLTYILAILDGWGVNLQPNPYDAIAAAEPRNFQQLFRSCPNALLKASGEAVGLPEGQMGNSEVGHLTIGSGRIIYQELPRIDREVSTGGLAKHKALEQLLDYHKQNPQTRCHLIGLISDGGVHAHIDHLIALSDILKGVNLKIHAIADGRDSPPRSFLGYMQRLHLPLSTISGRYYAMDRDKRWERTQSAYDNIFSPRGHSFTDPVEYVMDVYRDHSDEFIPPAHLIGYDGVREGDTVIISNFRADRIRQLVQLIIDGRLVNPYHQLMGMAHYSDSFEGDITTLFQKNKIKNTLGDVLAASCKTQMRLAETEKYAHVTYFFDGGVEKDIPGVKQLMVPSPAVSTYDLTPEMSVDLLGQHLLEAISSKSYDFICCNFSNADMVGHTGNFPATVSAIRAIDKVLGQVASMVRAYNCHLLVTADHGNAEMMYDTEGQQPHTSHTTNPVPLIYLGPQKLQLRDGGLSDIVPTLLELMGLSIPSEMTGRSLII